MAGIYFHIPFCKQACNYCDFHFSTRLQRKPELLLAMKEEILLRKEELKAQPIETIYFGGGTPSLLNQGELLSFFELLDSIISFDSVTEITLEANPDDLTTSKLKELQASPINRLSIGIQSFFEEDLRWMNRAHSAKQAKECIIQAQNFGFTNLTIDLIYGSPTTTDQMWEENLATWLSLDIPHLSSYCLTVESNTALAHAIQTGKIQALYEEKAIHQFDTLLHFCDSEQVEAYEISNYAKNQQYAIHNTNYWMGKPYIGIGPSAHSFDGQSLRRGNIANNHKYIQAIREKQVFWQEERLEKTEQINEYLLTKMRTKWGISESDFTQKFGVKQWNQLLPKLGKEIQQQFIHQQEETYLLTQKGKHIADTVIANLFADS